MKNPHDLLSVAETAKLAGVNPATVRREIKVTRRLPAQLDGDNRHYEIKRSDAERWKEGRKVPRKFAVRKNELG